MAGSGVNAWSQSSQNRTNRQFAQEQGQVAYDRNMAAYNLDWNNQLAQWSRQNDYDQERWNQQNAYNKSMWDLQNEYNSPAAQMQRYRDAGLNPALMYGTGGGNAGSIATVDMAKHSMNAAHPQGVAPVHSEGIAPQWGNMAIGGLQAYQGAIRQKLENDNLRRQGDLINAETIARAATTANTEAGTAKTRFDLGLASDLRKTQIQAQEANLRKVLVDINNETNAGSRAQDLHGYNLEESRRRIVNLGKEGRNLDNLDETQKYYNELHRMGVSEHDNALMRYLGRGVNEIKNYINAPSYQH